VGTFNVLQATLKSQWLKQQQFFYFLQVQVGGELLLVLPGLTQVAAVSW
jgi:hypothetical protein